jgi:cell division protein FtsQ
MNRRLAPSTARNNPARKSALVRKTGKRDRIRSIESTPTPRKSLPGKGEASPRIPNRRRPAPKKPRRTEPSKTWRERAAHVRQSALGWIMRRRDLVRRSGRFAVYGTVAAAVLWVGHQTVRYVHGADAFAIRDIIIEGNQHLEDIDVRRAARLHIGSNIFEISSEEARNYLMQNPWVSDASVVRKLPSRVRIEVTEHKPVALVALDQLYLASEDGAVFKRLGVDDPADLPVITGIASERFYDDLEYRATVLLRSMALLQDYEGAGLAQREPVSEIHFDATNGIELFVGRDGMNVRLGNGQHRQKLRRFRQVLERLEREKTRPSYVYLDNVRSPERVTVRLP